LIGGQHALDALANPHQFPLQGLFALLGKIGGASDGEPTIQFLVNQGGVFEQPNHLGPDDLIQQVLPHGTTRAAGPAEMPPPV